MMLNREGSFEEWDFNFPRLKLGKYGKYGSYLILGIIIFLWLLSGLYIVGPDEQGVVRRFGKMVRITSSGINWRMPYPFETVDTPKVTEIKRIEIGFRTIDQGPPARYIEIPVESLMLTGDENIVDCNLIVQFRIIDAPKYLFNVRDPNETVRHASEAALRSVIGQHLIDEALTTGIFEIQEETKTLLQRILDKYECGVSVIAVQLQNVQPPEEVIEAFKDVASAKEDSNRVIRQAEAYNNDVIPRVRGNAEVILREAEAYKQERINRAQGDTEKFLQVLKEYQGAKIVTEKRMYIETMERILPSIQKYILRTEGSSGGLFNILQLPRETSEGGLTNE